MKITGIIAEYNPFHKGHEYHIQMARKKSECDAILVVMSGNYVQRGEPAIIDKYKRAASAVHGGADIVIELPMPFSCQNAEIFSYGAVSELKKIPVTYLSFGCEDENIDILKEIAFLQNNNKEYNLAVKHELSKGISYPSALTNAFKEVKGFDVSDIISRPNNILGIEYIKNSLKLNCTWNYIPIKRIGSSHNDLILTNSIDSATAIRKSILKNNIQIPYSLTAKSRDMILKFYKEHNNYNCLNNYMNLIYYKILDLGPEGLNNIYEISEGLNNKIYANVFKFNNIDNYIMSIKSKRYTFAKLRRIMLNILLDIKKENISNIMSTSAYRDYIKVLAFNDIGREVIKEIRNFGTPVINRFSDFKKYNIDVTRTFSFNLSDRSSNIYYLPLNNRRLNEEYLQNAIYVK